MKQQSILQAGEHLRYIHKTLDVPYGELLSVINIYSISPQRIAQYLHGLKDEGGEHTNDNERYAQTLKYL